MQIYTFKNRYIKIIDILCIYGACTYMCVCVYPYIHQLYKINGDNSPEGVKKSGRVWYANFLILHRYSLKLMVQKTRG